MSPIIASEASLDAAETLAILALIVIAGPLLAEKARLPGLVGFMLGGTLLGPFGLKVLSVGQFDAVGSLGILYLMFMAGLELDMDIFDRYRKAAVQFGIATFIAPFAIGWWVGAQIGLSTASAILLGSLWASHTLVALPIVKRAGLSGSRAVAVAAGATIITDTLALLTLAVISSGAGEELEGKSSASTLATIGGLLLGLAVLVALTLWVLPRLGRWFYTGPGNDRSVRFMFLIGSMALGGLVAELGGIEGIVGAFFAGLGLNRLVPKRSALMDRVEFFGSSFFIPAFLISVGMLIDPAVLFDLDTLRFAGAFLLVVVSGKGLGAIIARPVFHFSWSEVALLFSLTIGQAAATLAAALVGVNIGLFDQQTLNAVVLAVLVTVIATSVLTRISSGLVEPERTLVRPIGSSVVVPITPDPAQSRGALHLAGLIARADTGTVTPMVVLATGQSPGDAVEQAHAIVEEASAIVRGSGAEDEGLVRVDASLKSAVLNTVAERMASLIVLIAPTGKRLPELAFGGPIYSIGDASPVPTILASNVPVEPKRIVLVVPGKPRTMGDQVDYKVAEDLVTGAGSLYDLPITALLGPEATIPALPEGSELVSITKISPATVSSVLRPGDLVAAPVGTVRRLLSMGGMAEAVHEGVGVVITAGPHRLREASTRAEEMASVLGYTDM